VVFSGLTFVLSGHRQDHYSRDTCEGPLVVSREIHQLQHGNQTPLEEYECTFCHNLVANPDCFGKLLGHGDALEYKSICRHGWTLVTAQHVLDILEPSRTLVVS
jgi:hypothetical protein